MRGCSAHARGWLAAWQALSVHHKGRTCAFKVTITRTRGVPSAAPASPRSPPPTPPPPRLHMAPARAGALRRQRRTRPLPGWVRPAAAAADQGTPGNCALRSESVGCGHFCLLVRSRRPPEKGREGGTDGTGQGRHTCTGQPGGGAAAAAPRCKAVCWWMSVGGAAPGGVARRTCATPPALPTAAVVPLFARQVPHAAAAPGEVADRQLQQLPADHGAARCVVPAGMREGASRSVCSPRSRCNASCTVGRSRSSAFHASHHTRAALHGTSLVGGTPAAPQQPPLNAGVPLERVHALGVGEQQGGQPYAEVLRSLPGDRGVQLEFWRSAPGAGG